MLFLHVKPDSSQQCVNRGGYSPLLPSYDFDKRSCLQGTLHTKTKAWTPEIITWYTWVPCPFCCIRLNMCILLEECSGQCLETLFTVFCWGRLELIQIIVHPLLTKPPSLQSHGTHMQDAHACFLGPCVVKAGRGGATTHFGECSINVNIRIVYV